MLHKRGENTAAVGLEVFSKNLSGTVEADNYCAKTCHVHITHQCVHRLPVEENICLGLIVVIKSMM